MEKDFVKIKPCKKVDTLSAEKKPSGWLVEIISDKDGFAKNLNGQVYMTTINPGVEKGYHIHAVARYYITCIRGRIKSIIYRDQFMKQTIELGDDDFKTYELIPGTAHCMVNIGDEEAYILCYRFPSWSVDLKEQLDIKPREIETKEAWKKINKFVKSFKNKK